MIIRLLVIGLGCFLSSTWAAERWSFTNKYPVSGEPRPGIFHHLDGAGRKHIAVTGSHVAVAWEDDRSGAPQVYAAVKTLQGKTFSAAIPVSFGQEAYEPAITALDQDRFVVAWEQDGSVYASLLQSAGKSEVVKLSSNQASHVSLASFEQQVFAVWREQQGRKWSLQVAQLNPADGNLSMTSNVMVEARKLSQPVLYPSIAASVSGLCVAWEDRRAGHTRLLFSHQPFAAEGFSAVEHLNEFLSNRNEYDKGNGVTRVSIHTFAENDIIAAWMDKRRGGVGYGIFAALGDSGGAAFGPNERVHSQKGDQLPHNNPVVAGNLAGDFVVAWDDFRNGDSDIWLSSYNEDDEWTEDFSPHTASGPGEQSHVSATLDDEGGLHLLWIERADPLSPTSLWYSYGR